MSGGGAGGRGVLLLVEDPAPWFTVSPGERRQRLEDERSRLLARAVGDHLPVELAERARELTVELRVARGEW